MAGYHLDTLPLGTYGELSKVYEEIAELQDAEKQGATLMLLQELSDVIGAIEGYLNNHHPTITLDDLIVMKNITKRAFQSGNRVAKQEVTLNEPDGLKNLFESAKCERCGFVLHWCDCSVVDVAL